MCIIYINVDTEDIDDDVWRDHLIRLIVEYYINNGYCMKSEDFRLISDAIVQKFPGEKQVFEYPKNILLPRTFSSYIL